jgi:hypothetical protein
MMPPAVQPLFFLINRLLCKAFTCTYVLKYSPVGVQNCSDKPDARLIGCEYIISERLFNGLPEEEKRCEIA